MLPRRKGPNKVGKRGAQRVSKYQRGRLELGSAENTTVRQRRLRSDKLQARLEVIAVFVLTIIISAAALYSSTIPNVSFKTVGFANQADDLELKRYVAAELEGQGFKSNFKPSLDTQKLEDDIAANPLVAKASVRLNIFQARPKVLIELEQPAAWFNKAGKVYLVGKSGRVMGAGAGSLKAYAPSSSPELLRIEAPPGGSLTTDLEIGSRVLSTDDLDFMSQVQTGLKGRGAAPEAGLILRLTANPRELVVDRGEGVPAVKMFLDAPAGQQVAAAYETIDYLASLPQAAGVGYIDVRLAPRVVYK